MQMISMVEVYVRVWVNTQGCMLGTGRGVGRRGCKLGPQGVCIRLAGCVAGIAYSGSPIHKTGIHVEV